MLGFQAAPLGRGEPFTGDLEAGEVEQCLLRPAETFFEPGAEWSEGRSIGRIGTHAGKRLGEQSGALGLRGHAEGAQ